MKKKISTLFAFGILAVSISAQQAEKKGILTITPSINNSALINISANGNYSVGYSTGLSTIYSKPDNQFYYQGNQNSDSGDLLGVALTCIDNNGVAYGGYSFEEDISVQSACIYKNGKFRALPAPAKAYSAGVLGCSADGTKQAGWAQTGMNYKPLLWNNEELIELKYPETDLFNNEPQGACASVVAPDGSIYGRYICGLGTSYLCRWTDVNEECEILFRDLQFNEENPVTLKMPVIEDYPNDIPGYNKAFMEYFNQINKFTTKYQIEPNTIAISPNGRYLSGTVYETVDNSESTYKIPFRYDLSTDEMKMLTQYQDALSLTVTDNGSMSIAYPYREYFRNTDIYISNRDECVKLEDYVMDFGIDLLNLDNGLGFYNEAIIGSGTTMIANDGADFYGYIFTEGLAAINYTISLSETTTGIDDNKANSDITFRNNKISLQSNSDISIYNVSGKLIGSFENVNNADMSKFAKGIYIVHVANNSYTLTKKLIVR